MENTEVMEKPLEQSSGSGNRKPKDRRAGRSINKLSSCLLVLFLFLSVCITKEEMAGSVSRSASAGAWTKTVNRISYGVIFEYNQGVILRADSWTHLFVIKLPEKIFREEQLFLKALHEGSSPTLAFC